MKRYLQPTQEVRLKASKHVEGNNRSFNEFQNDRENPKKYVWNRHEGSLYWRNHGNVSSNATRIAAFDLDGTLVVTKSGKAHAEDQSDWLPFHKTLVKSKLQSLVDKSYKIVIFSNQRGVTTRQLLVEDIQKRVDAVLEFYDIPVQVFLATADDMFRKPRVGAWEYMIQQTTFTPILSDSFFVGDAAGRPSIPKLHKKDFSDSDFKFSLNIGIRFYTPETYFLDKTQSYPTKFPFDPRSLGSNHSSSFIHLSENQEIVIMVGPPGVGKSYLSRTFFSGYVHINQDTLRTVTKCLAKTREGLNKGQSVVIDNQNRDVKTRKHYIELALSYKHPVSLRAIYFNLPKEYCFHFNTFRSLSKTSPEHRQDKLPPMVIHSFYKYHERPQLTEGFTEIVEVNQSNFSAGPFDELNEERLFHMFLN